MQITDTILMVRPSAFGYNQQTAASNSFQKKPDLAEDALHQKALQQFDVVVNTLQRIGVNVIVADDTPLPIKPDAIFPNNWINTTPDGSMNIFPMQAPNRREEKRDAILQLLQNKFIINAARDWTEYEAEDMYLEGTGSLVMDHENKVAYAALSPRTHPTLAEKFGATTGYRVISFAATDVWGKAIYHTNVMLCIGEGFAVLCPKCIPDDTERVAVAQLLEASGHQNIYIEPEQMQCFAGNMLHLKTTSGEKVIVLSQTAFDCLRQDQIERLQKYGGLLPVDVSVIEEASGGSIRCMMAEIFLEPKVPTAP